MSSLLRMLSGSSASWGFAEHAGPSSTWSGSSCTLHGTLLLGSACCGSRHSCPPWQTCALTGSVRLRKMVNGVDDGGGDGGGGGAISCGKKSRSTLARLPQIACHERCLRAQISLSKELAGHHE